MTKLDSILKSRDITLPTKGRLVKAMVFPEQVPLIVSRSRTQPPLSFSASSCRTVETDQIKLICGNFKGKPRFPPEKRGSGGNQNMGHLKPPSFQLRAVHPGVWGV